MLEFVVLPFFILEFVIFPLLLIIGVAWFMNFADGGKKTEEQKQIEKEQGNDIFTTVTIFIFVCIGWVYIVTGGFNF